MSWLDHFRRRRPAPPVTVTRGEDVAVFVPAADAPTLQMELGRAGWNSRIFDDPGQTPWDGLIRNLPVAVVVRPGVDPAPVAKALAAHDALKGVPLVVCGADAASSGGLAVPTDRVDDLVAALDALRGSES